MPDTAPYDVVANRFAPFADYVDYETLDFTGATCKLQVRDRPNGGEVRADVVPTVTIETVEGVNYSRIAWEIDELTMEAMPLDGANPDGDVTLYHDLHLTPVGEPKFVVFSGKFIVKVGVTE